MSFESVKLSIKEDMADVARSDTPQQVKITDTYAALIIWAVGRFGIAIVAFYGCMRFTAILKSIMSGILNLKSACCNLS